MKLLMMSSSIWSLNSRASYIVNGDLMFFVRYDIGYLLVFIIVNIGYAGVYRAKFLTLLPLVIVILPCWQPM